jgi:hypothetical protein
MTKEYHVINPKREVWWGSGFAKASDGYTTSFNCIENKNKLSFFGVVPGE